MYQKGYLHRKYRAVITGIVLAGMLLSMAGCAGKDAGGSSSSGSQSSQAPASSLPGENSSSEPSSAVDPSSDDKPTGGGVDSQDDWQLILVSKKHPMSENYQVDTVEIEEGKRFDVRAADQLRAMFAAARKDGNPLYLVSTYRTIAYQKNLYNRKVNEMLGQGMGQEQAEAEAANIVAPPGTSEHNTGLAADIVSADWYSKHDDLYDTFDQTAAYKWLSQNAYKFGFVLRYPKDKKTLPTSYTSHGTTAMWAWSMPKRCGSRACALRSIWARQNRPVVALCGAEKENR